MTVDITASVGKNGENSPEDVRLIQTLLNQIQPLDGGPAAVLKVNGEATIETVEAITQFQTHNGLPADGRIDAGGMTLRHLAVLVADEQEPDILDARIFQFTFDREIGFGAFDSTKPHVPGEKSGVTIGPGYDMKFRKREEIVADLTAIGAASSMATTLSSAAGLVGDEAEAWVTAHADVAITREQEKKLFEVVLVPQYVKRARRHIDLKFGTGGWTALDDDRKAIFFEYEYNVGLSKFPKFTKHVFEKDWRGALEEYERTGLDSRNKLFRERFLDPKLN